MGVTALDLLALDFVHGGDGQTARAALRESLRANGVPTSRPFDYAWSNYGNQGQIERGANLGYDVPRPGGGSLITPGSTDRFTVRNDAGGHAYPDDPSQNRGPHFNDPAKAHYPESMAGYEGRGHEIDPYQPRPEPGPRGPSPEPASSFSAWERGAVDRGLLPEGARGGLPEGVGRGMNAVAIPAIGAAALIAAQNDARAAGIESPTLDAAAGYARDGLANPVVRGALTAMDIVTPTIPGAHELGGWVQHQTGSELAGLGTEVGVGFGALGAAAYAFPGTAIPLMGATALVKGPEYLLNNTDWGISGQTSSQVLSNMGIDTSHGFGQGLAAEFNSTNQERGMAGVAPSLTAFHQMYTSNIESGANLDINRPDNLRAALRDGSFTRDQLTQVQQNEDKLATMASEARRVGNDEGIAGGSIYFPDGTHADHLNPEYARAFNSLVGTGQYGADYLGDMTPRQVIDEAARVRTEAREQEISNNIDREDADTGRAMREQEISNNIDREDAELGAAMTAAQQAPEPPPAPDPPAPENPDPAPEE